MGVTRNIVLEPRLLPGGGASEMHIAVWLHEQAKFVEGAAQWPFRAVGDAFEVIPRTLSEDCGADTVRVMTELRARHANNNGATVGIDGTTGKVADINDTNIWEPYSVKIQTIKTAIESATMLLRIDDIVSGSKAKNSAYGEALNSGQLDGE